MANSVSTLDSYAPPVRAGRSCFVLAVCGATEYLDELHYALRALSRHSRADVLVVTDRRRNARAIESPHVIDVSTPTHFDHHQASIFLKTSLHRIVPQGRSYCYLDTDIIAVNSGVDAIFARARGPITFAADHGRIHQFSPFAVRCGCPETQQRDLQEIATLKQEVYARPYIPEPAPDACRTPADYERRAGDRLLRMRMFLACVCGQPSKNERGDPLATRWRRFWLESQDAALHEPEFVVRQVEQATRWRRDRRRQSWVSPVKNDVYHLQCDHLVEQIRKTFGIVVHRRHWQHWNGGVFLFDDRSHFFLDAWHEKTIRIFDDPAWRTRDQGTLATTAWEFGLQDAAVLPRSFNLIADSHFGGLMVSADGESLSVDGFLTREHPSFVHVIHRFGDPTWDVWNWVASRAESG